MLADFKTRRRSEAAVTAPPAPSTQAVALDAPRPMVDCWQHIGVWGNGSCVELKTHLHCRNCPTYAAAAMRFLDARPPAGYRREWTEHLAETTTTVAAGTALLVFRIGDEWLALGIGVMEEVGESRPIHSLPHRREGVLLGVVNVRGELLACVSVGRLLGIDRGVGRGSALPDKSSGRLLVVRHAGERYAFPVTEVRGVQHLVLPDAAPAPAPDDQVMGAAGRGRVEWRGRSVCCLDEAKLFATLNRSLA
ncbi:MAG: chemotaxis protein CheW [Proteobacteria bacterium]|jgi:chemotaxis-related protein WspD|nr:chemotaxis protein CheW [Pseudomonadota bacterium]